jgi:hypothetical protein
MFAMRLTERSVEFDEILSNARTVTRRVEANHCARGIWRKQIALTKRKSANILPPLSR